MARICKNYYLMSWVMELIEKERFDTIHFIYRTVGHTNFGPDTLFSSIAKKKTFYNSGVFCITMLHHITQLYATSSFFTSRLMKHWKAALEQKYSVILGNTELHDILISKKSGKVTFVNRKQCFDGDYTMHNYKYNCKKPLFTVSLYEPFQLTAEKGCQLSEQHRRYIKQDVPWYVIPVFLNQQYQNPVSAVVVVAHSLPDASHGKNRQCTYPGCNGS